MLRPKVSIKEKGKSEWKKATKELEKLKDAYVSVGLHEDAGAYDSGVSVVQVGLWNEFGTETAPERSWLRSTVDEHAGDLNRWRVELLKKIMAGEETAEHALETLGFRVRELVRNKINSNVPPPNAPSTIAAKHRAGVAPHTLVNSTLLSRSVEYKVVIK